jgi:polysaccharide biosynthesis PFTS motif protein
VSIIYKLRNGMSSIRIPNFQLDNLDPIFKDTGLSAELVARQYLMVRATGRMFTESLLASFGGKSAVHVLPRYLLDYIHSNGIRVDFRLSRLLWNLYVFVVWGYGIILYFKMLKSCLPKLNQKSISIKNTAHFYGIIPENIPSNDDDKEVTNLLTWFASWRDRNPLITSISHTIVAQKVNSIRGVKVNPQKSDFLPFEAWANWKAFVFHGFRIIVRSFWDMIQGRWWSPLLLAEAIKASVIRYQNERLVALEYWFSHTSYLYRPIWTYTAERKGASVILYFYSVNSSAIQKRDDEKIPIGLWSMMTWPNVVLWNKGHEEFLIKHEAHFSKSFITGCLPFADSGGLIRITQKPAAAVFDIQPFRPYKHAQQAQVYEYYSHTSCIKFVKDVAAVLLDCRVAMIWKRKRDIGKNQHPIYNSFCKSIADDHPAINAVDYGVAAHRLISSCQICISMPFTSTALISQELGIPACYYDPLQIIDPLDPAAHGVTIIGTKEGLSSWVKTNLVQNC